MVEREGETTNVFQSSSTSLEQQLNSMFFAVKDWSGPLDHVFPALNTSHVGSLMDSSKYPDNNTITFIAQRQGPERVPKTIGNHSKDLGCQSMSSHFYSKLNHSLATSSVTSKGYRHQFQVPMSSVSIVFGALFGISSSSTSIKLCVWKFSWFPKLAVEVLLSSICGHLWSIKGF